MFGLVQAIFQVIFNVKQLTSLVISRGWLKIWNPSILCVTFRGMKFSIESIFYISL